MTLYESLLWRGMIKDVSNEDLAKNHLNENSIKFYVGYDPTGQSLTVGHLVQIMRMKYLEKHGHKPVVLIGGATGLIGDPKETQERKLLTLEESLRNAQKIENQIRKLLPDAQFVNNYDWISKVDLISFLRDYGKHFNVSYMIAKDTVQKRLAEGISYTEFSYMILQSMDWVHLYKNENVKIQFGGSDQWGNITSGLELMRKVVGEHDAVGLSSPLLLKADGTKFGKSESGALWLDENLTTPYEMYQYFLNTSDNDLENYLKLLTLLEKDEIVDLLDKTKAQPELRIGQKRLAEEVVRFVHGEEKLKEALAVTEALFNGDFSSLSENAYLMLSKTLDTVELSKETLVMDALKETKLASSNREVREFMQANAVFVNGEVVTDTQIQLKDVKIMYEKYIILRRGKKKYALVILKD
ncbi:tyrosine--tRNA ligase [Acholeplasma equifetale]|uniref:tyrosine--tRNA ligase n=1 Tax=Acholeplasma equifetale TaxID=264634 RepID=UPI00047C39C3|nr:tyrosine--tRNA ligase [Acholeplasma equifetale]